MNLKNAWSRLVAGETVSLKARGTSMTGIINDGQRVEISPDTEDVEVGDVVLSTVRGNMYLHKISALDGRRVQISNNRGHVNGWTNLDKVWGLVTKVDGQETPGGRRGRESSVD